MATLGKTLDCLTYDELFFEMENFGLPKFRCEQIFSWIAKGVDNFENMTNLSKELREKLCDSYNLTVVTIYKKFVSAIDNTKKYLLKLPDDNIVEAVAMEYKHGITLCISTQVGCYMGCKFCASTIGGKIRNLTAGELLRQIIVLQNDIGSRISNIVLMGIGEPLDNYHNVLNFLKNVNNPKGLGVGYRHISLSTCGLVDKIRDLSKENIPLTLSISLHAPNDEIRNQIMPVNKKHNVTQLIGECKEYLKVTGRRISFEYILIKGLNDSMKTAEELCKLLCKMGCHINLIPANFVSECGFEPSSKETVRKFAEYLNNHGMNATVRRELGSDISASCGQLRKGEISGN